MLPINIYWKLYLYKQLFSDIESFQRFLSDNTAVNKRLASFIMLYT